MIDKFNLNPTLVNINNFKPYQFVEDNTFQPILIQPNNLLLEESIEKNKFCNPFIKELVEINTNDLFVKKPVETERTCNPFIKKEVKISTNDMLEKKSIEELDNLVKLEEFISYANTF
jgi:hypothetical protein